MKEGAVGTVAPLEFAYIAAVGYHMLPKRSLTPGKQHEHQHVKLLRPKSILLGQTKYDDRAYTLRYVVVLTARVFITVICNSKALLKPSVCAQVVDGGVAYPSA